MWRGDLEDVDDLQVAAAAASGNFTIEGGYQAIYQPGKHPAETPTIEETSSDEEDTSSEEEYTSSEEESASDEEDNNSEDTPAVNVTLLCLGEHHYG